MGEATRSTTAGDRVKQPKNWVTGGDKSHIHCQTWNHRAGRMVDLGVLYANADKTRRDFAGRGISVQERILSADGQRVWTLSKRQWRRKESRPGQAVARAARFDKTADSAHN